MKDSNLVRFDKTATKYLNCDCGSEVLFIHYDAELFLFDFSIYESLASFETKNSWKNKIRYIWRILTNHHPYNDQIVLSKKKAKMLADFINSLVS